MSIRIIAVIALVCASTQTIKAQNLNYGATVNFGGSVIYSDIILGTQQIESKLVLSGSIGLFGELSLGEKSFIGAEFNWFQMGGKEVINDIIITEYDFNTGQINEVGRLKNTNRIFINYLGLPIYYRYQFNKIGLKAGFRTMFLLMSSSNSKIKGTLRGEPYNSGNKSKDLPLNTLDYGPTLGLDYQISDKFRARADVYFALSTIVGKDLPYQRQNGQFTLGLNYFFGK